MTAVAASPGAAPEAIPASGETTMSIASRRLEYRETKRKAEVARRQRLKYSETFAKLLGVSAAGLEWLGKLVANPDRADKRGTEYIPLLKKGLVAEDPHSNYRHGFTITDAGREIVRRAREMGW
jgi:predicted transcriptional regulator